MKYVEIQGGRLPGPAFFSRYCSWWTEHVRNEEVLESRSRGIFYKIEKDGTGQACGTCGVEVRWGVLRERDHLGDLGVEGRIILRWILENEFGRR